MTLFVASEEIIESDQSWNSDQCHASAAVSAMGAGYHAMHAFSEQKVDADRK